jgi:antitoxin MazE
MYILRLYVKGSKEGSTMQTKIQKWGNSQGLRLNKELLESAGLKTGDEVEISVEGSALVIVPARKIRGKYSLEDLVACIPKDHQPKEVDWGKPSGREEW